MSDTPLKGLCVVVPPDWIDVNGHTKASHYGLAVYDVHVNLTEAIGLGEAYASTPHGLFVIATMTMYTAVSKASTYAVIR